MKIQNFTASLIKPAMAWYVITEAFNAASAIFGIHDTAILVIIFITFISSETESDIGRSSASDYENLCLFEKRSKKINKGRWTKEEVGIKV